jgi:gamma-glutamyltranspeptidase/glutathione hydrolase
VIDERGLDLQMPAGQANIAPEFRNRELVMIRTDFLRRCLATISLMLLMIPPGYLYGQAANSAAPPATSENSQQQPAQAASGRGGRGAGRVRNEGTSITVDHAMRTSIPEPARDNAFSMTTSQYGITATLQTLASAAGSAILEKGGNAVDAAIAANAAVGVIEPSMNGVGGDLFAIYWDNKAKKLYALNASGWTPAAWTPETFKEHNITRLSGIWSVTVPGVVAGWQSMHDKFGKLSLAEDLKPAEALAENGFPVSEANSVEWEKYGLPFANQPEFARVFLPNGSYVHLGQIFENPDVANTLRLIGANGRDAFYKGPIAQAILKVSQEQGGVMTAADLADYQPEWVDPISTTYHGWTIYETPPNSQGLAALSMLNIMEQYPIKDWGHDSAQTLHIEMEAKSLAYADMLKYVGDPRMVQVPTAQLISKQLAVARAKGITDRANCSVLPSEVNDQMERLQSETTYLATVDRDGDIVSLIQSNSGNFGSGLVPDHMGFVLHNRGGAFTLEPGQPNSVGPHKRPLHTIIPAFMQKDGVSIGFGIQSGFNQAQAHAQFVANIVDFGMNIQAALDAARFNEANSGCGVNIETGYPLETIEDLFVRGHQVTLVPRYSLEMGKGNAVEHDDARGVNFGASDPRTDGQATPEMMPF